jgi:hypothetical protein
MAVEVDVKLTIECNFRDDQNEGDDFNLWFDCGHDFWLNQAEVEELMNRLGAALVAYHHANRAITEDANA